MQCRRMPFVLVAGISLLCGARFAEAAATTPDGTSKANPPDQPNVILVLTDDQGYGDLSCHGNPVLKTPHIDRLARESIRLTDFHVAPMCTPTRGELMTGQYALRNGAYCVCSGKTFLRPGVPTMSEIFAANGYRTGLFGKWHLGDNYPHRPNDRGFHEAVYHLGWGITSTPDYWNNDYQDDFFRHNGKIKRYPGYCTDVWFDEAIRWMKTCQAKKEPFLAYIAVNAPHGPFWVPEKYREPYKHLDRDTAGFFGMIANLDENMAKLDAILAETGLRENALLIFMTDNGGTGGIKAYNAGMRGAKASLYDGGHRVPCFLRWPNGALRPAGDVTALAHVVDIVPTLIELCGLKAKKGTGTERPVRSQSPFSRFDGVSLAQILRGKEQPELAQRKVIVQYGGLVETTPRKWDAAVLWNRWRFVNGTELYNLDSDPAQQTDAAAQHPDIVAQMRRSYEEWWAEIEPTLSDFVPIHVGSDAENPTCLTSLDWLSPTLVLAAQTVDIRQLGQTPVVEGSLPLGRPQPALNGPWNIVVERDGPYEISLRRWPVEADTALAAGLPPFQGFDGAYPEGRAAPIAKARLQVGDLDLSTPVGPNDKAATFTIRLSAGKTQLKTWFYNADGQELFGALYVYVRRLVGE